MEPISNVSSNCESDGIFGLNQENSQDTTQSDTTGNHVHTRARQRKKVVLSADDDERDPDESTGTHEDNKGTYQDKDGREHVTKPTAGTLHLRLRSDKFNSSSAATHYVDMVSLLEHRNVKNLVLIVDGGSDYTCRSQQNTFWYGLLFIQLNLDSLHVVQYAAGYSAYNPIERAWARCSSYLVG